MKKNIIYNYASQLYVTLIGIVLLPLYIKHMGAEAYGLVGFFVMLQAWFMILDLGLTPTVSRETARYYGGAISSLSYRQFFRSLNMIFLSVAIIGGALLWSLAEAIASSWLNAVKISDDEVILAIQLMALIVALRWMGGLYRGLLIGAEKFVWLSIFNVITSTLRSIGVLVVMWHFGFTPYVFFTYQAVISGAEIIILWCKSLVLLPKISSRTEKIGWSISPVKSKLKFALTIAFTSSIWVLITQSDKLILSKILPLADYGYFTLAVMVASGIMIISGPVSNAVLPHMTRLYAQDRRIEMLQIYRNSTQLVAVIAGAVSVTLAFCAEHFLYAWTGDLQLVEAVSPILRLYAIGNCFLAITSFPYYLQYAKGNLRYHLYGNVLMIFLLLPSIMFFATYFGSIGAGYAWCVVNILLLFFWVAFVHSKIEPGIHLKWLFHDVIIVILPSALIGVMFFFSDFSLSSRIISFSITMFVGIVCLAISCAFSSMVRSHFCKFFFKMRLS
nr:oligosaccharide flippase family protein [Rheinheimera oceanensis]